MTTIANGPRAATTPTADQASAVSAGPSGGTASAETQGVQPSGGWLKKAGERVDQKVDDLFGQAKGKVVQLALEQVSHEHDAGHTFSFGSFAGNVKLGEQVALPGTEAFKALVAGDRLRAAGAGTPDSAWVKTTAGLGTSAGFPAGAGVSVGFNGAVEVTAVAQQQASSFKQGVADVGAQAKAMVFPVDSAGLQSLNAAPGTEWMFRGQAGGAVGLGASTTQTYGVDQASATVTLGASVSASAQAVYTKNVKVLEGGKVFVQVARQTSEGVAGSVGLKARLGSDLGNEATGALRGQNVGTVAGVDLAAQGGKLADSALRKVEDATQVEGSVSGSVGATQKLLAQSVLDLNTASGRAAFDQIMRSGPAAAADFITSNGLGVTFRDESTAVNTGVSLKLGSTTLLSTSTLRGTEEGTVVDAQQGTVALAEATYGRSVNGALPRLFIGEERSVAVRAGSLTKGGVTQDAVAVSLSARDPRLHGDELAALQRFAQGLGGTLEGLPTPGKPSDNLGKGAFDVSVALTDASVKQLQGRSAADITLAFAAAQKDLAGTATMPPWYAQPQVFGDYVRRYETANNPKTGTQDRQQIAQRYAAAFPGYHLADDVESKRAVEEMTKQVARATGRPVTEWGGLLESIGAQPSTDLRASILALRRLAGAEVVGFTVSAGGKSSTLKADGPAPKSMAEVVGQLLAPPA